MKSLIYTLACIVAVGILFPLLRGDGGGAVIDLIGGIGASVVILSIYAIFKTIKTSYTTN